MASRERIKAHKTTRERILTAFSIREDLSYTASLVFFHLPHGVLRYLVRRARELNVKLLPADGLAQRAHGALQPLFGLLTHTVHIARILRDECG